VLLGVTPGVADKQLCPHRQPSASAAQHALYSHMSRYLLGLPEHILDTSLIYAMELLPSPQSVDQTLTAAQARVRRRSSASQCHGKGVTVLSTQRRRHRQPSASAQHAFIIAWELPFARLAWVHILGTTLMLDGPATPHQSGRAIPDAGEAGEQVGRAGQSDYNGVSQAI
jgi:hypothetical protein